MAMRHSISAPLSLPSSRGKRNNRSASFGETSMSALQFDLPFPLRKSKLESLSGQDQVKYSQLATNNVYRSWHEAFARTVGFNEPSGIASLHEKLHRYDLNRVGCVGREGFVQALKLCRVPLTEQDMSQLFSDMDVRSLDKVDIEMFCVLVQYWVSRVMVDSQSTGGRSGRVEGSESSSVLEDDLLEALIQLKQKKGDFIQCCLQLGGEEYASKARMQGVDPSLLGSVDFSQHSSECGYLPFGDIWFAMRHIGVNNVEGLDNEVKQFALKHGAASIASMNASHQEVLVEPMALLQAAFDYLSNTNEYNTSSQSIGQSQKKDKTQVHLFEDIEHEMGKQQLYLCAVAWKRGTQMNNSSGGGGGHFRQQLLGRQDVSEVLIRGSLKLKPSEVHTLWFELCHMSMILKGDNSQKHDQRCNKGLTSSRQNFNEVMNTASVMKYLEVDEVFNKILNESKLKDSKTLNERGQKVYSNEVRLDDQYVALRNQGKMSEPLFERIPPSLHTPSSSSSSLSRQKSSLAHEQGCGLSSEDINGQRQSHRRNISNAASVSNPPFATGSSYNIPQEDTTHEPPPPPPPVMSSHEPSFFHSQSHRNQPSFNGQNGAHEVKKREETGGGGSSSIRVRSSFEQQQDGLQDQNSLFQQNQANQQRLQMQTTPSFPQANAQGRDQPRHLQHTMNFYNHSIPPPSHSPEQTRPRPPAGMRQEDGGYKASQRSDPTRADSLGTVPTQVTRCFPIRHGTGEYFPEDTMPITSFSRGGGRGDYERGNAPAIVHRLRDITREHRHKLDLIFPEVLNSDFHISRGDVQQGLRKVGVILRDTETENLFYFANSHYPNDCNSGDLLSVVLRLVLGLDVTEEGKHYLSQYRSRHNAVKFNELEEDRIMNQKKALMGSMYANNSNAVNYNSMHGGASGGGRGRERGGGGQSSKYLDSIPLSANQKRALLRVATRANRVIRVCEEVDGDGEGIVFWYVIEKALESSGILLDAEGLIAVKGAVINEQGMVSYPSLIFNLQEAAEEGRVPRRIGAIPSPVQQPIQQQQQQYYSHQHSQVNDSAPSLHFDAHFEDDLHFQPRGSTGIDMNHRKEPELHEYSQPPTSSSYGNDSPRQSVHGSQSDYKSNSMGGSYESFNFNNRSQDFEQPDQPSTQYYQHQHQQQQHHQQQQQQQQQQHQEDQYQQQKEQQYQQRQQEQQRRESDVDVEKDENIEKMKVLHKARGGIVLGFDFEDNEKASKIRHSLMKKRGETKQDIVNHSHSSGGTMNNAVAGRSSNKQHVEEEQPPRTLRTNTNTSSKDFSLASQSEEPPNKDQGSSSNQKVRLSNNNILSKDFVVCMDMEGRGAEYKNFHMTEKESEPTVENYRGYPRTRTSNTTKPSQDFLLANTDDDKSYNKYETDAMQITRQGLNSSSQGETNQRIRSVEDSRPFSDVNRNSRDFAQDPRTSATVTSSLNRSVNFSDRNEYQEADRYNDEELRNSSEFQLISNNDQVQNSSRSKRDQGPVPNYGMGSANKPVSKLEQVTAAVQRASQVVSSSVQSSETKWWLKRREAALISLLKQRELLKLLFQEEVEKKNQYFQEKSLYGDDCIDVEGLTIVLSSNALGLDLQLNQGSMKWTRKLARELLDRKGSVDWNTFISIVQFELENFKNYEQREQKMQLDRQTQFFQQEAEEKESKVSLPLRNIIREKFRGTALDMNGDGRRSTGDIRSLTAILRHAFKRSCGGGGGGQKDLSVRPQELGRVFKEFSVYLSDSDLDHFFQGLKSRTSSSIGNGSAANNESGSENMEQPIFASDVAALIWDSR